MFLTFQNTCNQVKYARRQLHFHMWPTNIKYQNEWTDGGVGSDGVDIFNGGDNLNLFYYSNSVVKLLQSSQQTVIMFLLRKLSQDSDLRKSDDVDIW